MSKTRTPLINSSDDDHGTSSEGKGKKYRKGPITIGGTIDPNLIYTTRRVAGECDRRDLRSLETALERNGINLLRLGNGLTLLRGKDLWDKLGERD